MTPDEAIDAVMRGPFDGIGRFDHVFEPPTPEVEAAMRVFLRALVEARPGVAYDVGYDAMHGITVDIGTSIEVDLLVSVSMWNDDSWATLSGPMGTDRVKTRVVPRSEATSLVQDALDRIDMVSSKEPAK